MTGTCVFLAYAVAYQAARGALADGEPEAVAAVERTLSALPPARRAAAALALEDVHARRPMRRHGEVCALLAPASPCPAGEASAADAA